MMRHYLINPTWICPFKCSYCWVEATVRMRPMFHAEARPWQDWAMAINRDGIELIDIAGGEPFVYDGLYELMEHCPRTMFGLSTNGWRHEEIGRFAARPRLINLISINCSLHPESRNRTGYLDRYAASINSLRSAGYPVMASIVCSGDNEAETERERAQLAEAGVHVSLSPFEDMQDVVELQDTPLLCQGGVDHLVLAPDGMAWPCLTTLRSPRWAETCLGNWIDGTLAPRRRIQPCHEFCYDFYVLPKLHEAGDMWGVKARRADNPEEGD